MVMAGISGMRLLFGMAIRWCRRFAPRPSASGWKLPGFKVAGQTESPGRKRAGTRASDPAKVMVRDSPAGHSRL